MDQVVTINILGQPFTFKTDSDLSEAKAVAEYVATSVDQARQRCEQSTLVPEKRTILILTALNITNEYFDLKKKHQKLLKDIGQRSTHLLQALESQLVY
ncbi:MAG: cell division protein ZapA [Desulfatitalea sp.]|nr:cell division protein ZapA [Desulfatitalea sp.]